MSILSCKNNLHSALLTRTTNDSVHSKQQRFPHAQKMLNKYNQYLGLIKLKNDNPVTLLDD